MQRQNALNYVRRLATLMNRQTLLARPPIGHHGSGFQSHAGVPAENELSLSHGIGLGRRLVHCAGFDPALERQIVPRDA
jgi:hypothetical protein